MKSTSPSENLLTEEVKQAAQKTPQPTRARYILTVYS